MARPLRRDPPMRAFVVTALTSLSLGCGGNVTTERRSGASTRSSAPDAGLGMVAPASDGGSARSVPTDPGCPAWLALHNAEGDSNVCSVNGLICVYPEGQAECAPDGPLKWLSLPLRAGCPETPAMQATACGTPGQVCDYITGSPGGPVSQFVTKYCCDGTTARWGIEPAGGCPTGQTCGAIHAADYDQSCSVDSDCIQVAEGDLCDLRLCTNCAGGSIRQSAQAQYDGDFAKKLPISDGNSCPCPPAPPAVCTNGVCGLSGVPSQLVPLPSPP